MNEKNKKLIFLIIAGLGLYLISAGISYAAFKYLAKGEEKTAMVSPVPTQEGHSKVDLSAPKTEICPLNGELFTKAEKDIWEKRRPIGVMIENHLDARPQSGLSKVDLVYEAVAEGGITRFLALYYCHASAEDVLVGPVRSARTYFLDLVSEYGDYPLYAHVGGANLPGKVNALGQIGDYGWLRMGNDLNQFSLGFPTYWRDYERLGRPVATEHTMYSTTDRLWEVAQKRGLTQTDKTGKRWDEKFIAWQFEKETAKELGEGIKIEFSFWKSMPDYDVSWEYDKQNNLYRRSNGGQSFQDFTNKEQLTARVVIVQFMKETGPVDELKHMLYQTIGNGKALIFQNGNVITGTWSKKSRTDRTYFKDEKGREVVFAPGQIWVEILPAGNQVKY